MVDPWITLGCERIHVLIWEVVSLDEVLGIPHVPPDIGVVVLAPRQNPYEGAEQKRQHDLKRKDRGQRSIESSGGFHSGLGFATNMHTVIRTFCRKGKNSSLLQRGCQKHNGAVVVVALWVAGCYAKIVYFEL